MVPWKRDERASVRVILNLFIDVTNRIDTMLRISDYRFAVPRQRRHAARDVTRAADISRERATTLIVFLRRELAIAKRKGKSEEARIAIPGDYPVITNDQLILYPVDCIKMEMAQAITAGALSSAASLTHIARSHLHRECDFHEYVLRFRDESAIDSR